MGPLSHIYVSTKVTGRNTPLLIFGSILPDIATTSRQEIGGDKIHYSPKEFYHFVQKRFPNLLDLAVGVRLHSNIDKGADYYSDEAGIGFAVIEGKKIAQDVKKLLRTEDERVGLGLAHNFIEEGVDLNLKDSHPEIFNTYSDSLNKLERPSIVNCLSEYLNLPKESIQKELQFFIDFLSPEHLSSVEQVVEGALIPLVELRFGKKVDSVLAKQILLMAKEITKDKYLDFLGNTVAKIKNDFAILLENTRDLTTT